MQRVAHLAAVLALSACGQAFETGTPRASTASGQSTPTSAGAGAGGATSGSTTSAGGTTNVGGSGAGSSGTGGSGTGGSGPVGGEIYGHSSDRLYRVALPSGVVTDIGEMTGCGAAYDLAIDANGEAYVSTSDGLFKIALATAECTLINTGAYPVGLSFVPKGTLDAGEEALVGYTGGSYFRVDRNTGAVAQLGTLGVGYSVSGDIVSVIGGGSYVAVVGNGCADCLVRVDPVTGAIVETYGDVGFVDLWGVAYSDGLLYGFLSNGQVVAMQPGQPLDAQLLTLTGDPIVGAFTGAGSTTAAPL